MNSRAAGALGGSAWQRRHLSAEHRFYIGYTAIVAAALVLGFARTFFLRAWYPEWTLAHAPPEPYFLFHGAVFVSWFVVLLAQPLLAAAGRIDLHRRVGTFGGLLAAAMVVVGTYGGLIAARRPGGFKDVPLPPLEFLAIPLIGLLLFAAFVSLGIARRRDVQSHKRYMLLASLTLLESSVARWPFDLMQVPLPIPLFDLTNTFTDLFLVPIVVWDLASRGRVHPVTLWGGLALIASQPLRLMLSQTPAWHAFAGWAVSLVG